MLFRSKVVSPEILHKSDAGGVKIGLKNADEVAQAITAMAAAPQIKQARVDGWLIEEMAPAGQEVVVGAVRDPNFGPLVMVGLGSNLLLNLAFIPRWGMNGAASATVIAEAITVTLLLAQLRRHLRPEATT